MAKTYIVDGNSLLFRAYYSTAYPGAHIMTTSTGLPTNAIFSFHNMIKKIKSDLTNNDHLFISFDAGKATFRKAEFEEYKAQRAPCPEELKIQMPIAREMLEEMDIYWKELEGYEGDDLAGSMALYASSLGDEVTLFTSDKDFLQLLDFSDKIHVCFLKKGLSETVDYTKDNLEALFGLRPNQITDFKGIAGDPSDNYKGIKGIGEVTTKKLLKEYDNLDGILKYCKEHPDNKTNQKIIAGEKEAIFFKKLATIETTLDMKEDYNKSSYVPYHKTKLSKFYAKYQLSQFLKNIDKMPHIVNDASSQLSLFDFDNEVEEEKSQNINIIQIKSFDDIKDKIIGLTYDSNKDNENEAALLGFALASKDNIYYLSIDNAEKDPSFNSYLSSNDKKTVYDLKGLQVLLARFKFNKLNNVTFDFLLASYILNSDIGQKREELFLNYSLSFNSNLNIACQTIKYTVDLKEKLIDKLKENNEYDLLISLELPLANILADMEIEGFPIDEKTLTTINIEYQEILNNLENEIYTLANKQFNINSPKQLEEVLFTDLNIPRSKKEKGTSIEVLNNHINDHEIVSKIIDYRLFAKLVNSYTTSLPEHIFADKKIHALYNQALTSTGRLSMSEPNLQNISIRKEEGKNIRKAFFYPSHEYYLLSIDYSQIELRMLAHVANITTLKEIFNEGKDIHTSTASKVFNVPFDLVTSEMRRRAKAVNFGIVYGISPYGLATQLNISAKEASELITQFKKTFEGIEQFQQSCIQKAREDGYVSTILNRRRYLKDINSSNRILKSFSERAATNTVIQGSAADLIKTAMIKCSKLLENYKSKIILQIHDELIFKVPKDELEVIKPLLIDCMNNALKLSVPLEVDANYALDWYEAH